MTHLVERLAELERHLDHLESLQPRVRSATDLERDMSLHNDVMFSLLMVCQLVIDIAAELAARRGDRFDDDRGAIRCLARNPRFDPGLVADLEPLAGFRNVLVHEYVAVDLERVVEAMGRLEPVRRFARTVAALVGEQA